MRVLVLGGTDLTAKLIERMLATGIDVAGGVYLEEEFQISYQTGAVRNLRYADLSSLYRRAGLPGTPFTGNPSILEFAQKLGAEFCLVAGWYHMVPRHLRALFTRGCAGLHASLLPKLRGGAPLNWAILSGATQTGVSLFGLGDGIDDGPVYGQRAFPVSQRASITELVEQSVAVSLRLVEECLPRIADGTCIPRPQEGEASYCLQREPKDSLIDWRMSAAVIDRLIRASTHPYAGAYTYWDGAILRLWASSLPEGPVILGAPGQIARIAHSDAVHVVTGEGSLEIVQATDDSGRDQMPALKAASNRRFTMG